MSNPIFDITAQYCIEAKRGLVMKYIRNIALVVGVVLVMSGCSANNAAANAQLGSSLGSALGGAVGGSLGASLGGALGAAVLSAATNPNNQAENNISVFQ